MTTISIGHPAIFTLKPNEVTIIDLSNYELDVPKRHRLGFKVSANARWQSDRPQITKHTGFQVKVNDEGLVSMETGWYKKNPLYFIPETEIETTVTFEVVPDFWS